jgi:uncharacterized membrane protein
MESKLQEKEIVRFFKVALVLKAIHGVIELIGGILISLISGEAVTLLVTRLTEGELAEDPNDFFTTFFVRSIEHLATSGKVFAVAYLIIHGLINLTLALGLLRGKRWAYPSAFGLLIPFVVYQIYRISLTYSLWLLVLTLFDLVVIALIYHEYKKSIS